MTAVTDAASTTIGDLAPGAAVREPGRGGRKDPASRGGAVIVWLDGATLQGPGAHVCRVSDAGRILSPLFTGNGGSCSGLRGARAGRPEGPRGRRPAMRTARGVKRSPLPAASPAFGRRAGSLAEAPQAVRGGPEAVKAGGGDGLRW